MKQTCQKSDGTKEKKIINAKEKIRLCSGNDFEEELKKNRDGREALIKELCK
ncbi:unnamed protein product, partial [Callosobruchus maculatus]